MPVHFYGHTVDVDPFESISFEKVIRNVEIADISLKFSAFQNVEKAIDLVFDWSDHQENLDPNILESLAPYFGTIWPSAVALAAYLARFRIQLSKSDIHVLELGCGLALPSVLLAKMGIQVTASDSHPSVRSFLKENISLNEPCSLQYCHSSDLSQKNGVFQMVIASDVLYEKKLVDIMAEAIHRYASSEKSQAVLADPGRAYIQEFSHKMTELGWDVEMHPWSVVWDGKSHEIFILHMRR